jgi:hypothetical protein
MYAQGYGNSKNFFNENYELIRIANEKCAEATSKFYQLIPITEKDYWTIRPINNSN